MVTSVCLPLKMFYIDIQNVDNKVNTCIVCNNIKKYLI